MNRLLLRLSGIFAFLSVFISFLSVEAIAMTPYDSSKEEDERGSNPSKTVNPGGFSKELAEYYQGDQDLSEFDYIIRKSFLRHMKFYTDDKGHYLATGWNPNVGRIHFWGIWKGLFYGADFYQLEVDEENTEYHVGFTKKYFKDLRRTSKENQPQMIFSADKIKIKSGSDQLKFYEMSSINKCLLTSVASFIPLPDERIIKHLYKFEDEDKYVLVDSWKYGDTLQNFRVFQGRKGKLRQVAINPRTLDINVGDESIFKDIRTFKDGGSRQIMTRKGWYYFPIKSTIEANYFQYPYSTPHRNKNGIISELVPVDQQSFDLRTIGYPLREYKLHTPIDSLEP